MAIPLREHEGRPLGRPREFVPDTVLEKIMLLFWRHGYDGLSMSGIQTGSGLSKPSLYACFGNKEQLYRAALDRYVCVTPSLNLSAVAEAKTPDDVITALLEAMAASMADAPGMGCMILTGMTAGSRESEHLARELSHRRRDHVLRLSAKLRHWLSAEDADLLSRCLSAAMQGVALQAHDGASPEEMNRLAGTMSEMLRARFSSHGRANPSSSET